MHNIMHKNVCILLLSTTAGSSSSGLPCIICILLVEYLES